MHTNLCSGFAQQMQSIISVSEWALLHCATSHLSGNRIWNATPKSTKSKLKRWYNLSTSECIFINTLLYYRACVYVCVWCASVWRSSHVRMWLKIKVSAQTCLLHWTNVLKWWCYVNTCLAQRLTEYMYATIFFLVLKICYVFDWYKRPSDFSLFVIEQPICYYFWWNPLYWSLLRYPVCCQNLWAIFWISHILWWAKAHAHTVRSLSQMQIIYTRHPVNHKHASKQANKCGYTFNRLHILCINW